MSSKYDYYFLTDDPIPYKNLLIHPVIMRDYYKFLMYYDCLLLENNIPDPKVLSLSYLGYLYYATTEENPYLLKLILLLELVLKLDKEKIETGYMGEKPVIKINDEVYTAEDFNEVRQIICDQNMIELPDLSIPKKVRDIMHEQKEYRQRMSGFKMCSLEDQFLCITVATAIPIKDLFDMTIRKFNKLLSRTDELIHYKIAKTAVLSGMVEFKDKNFPQHWMRDLENNKDKYDGTAIKYEEAVTKITADGKVGMGNK